MDNISEGVDCGEDGDGVSIGTGEYGTVIEQETDNISGQLEGLKELTPGESQERVTRDVTPDDIFTTITRLSQKPAPPETRFMRVWNSFDTERKGEVRPLFTRPLSSHF